MQNASARLDVALPLYTEHFGEVTLASAVESVRISRTKVSVLSLLEPVTTLHGKQHSGRRLHVTWSKWLESQGFQNAGYEGAMWSRKDKDGVTDGDTILVATHVDVSNFKT